MIDSGIFEIVLGVLIAIGILANIRRGYLRDLTSNAPEILIAVYLLSMGTIMASRNIFPDNPGFLHRGIAILLLLPYACKSGNLAEVSRSDRKSALIWLMTGLALAAATFIFDQGRRFIGNANFATDVLITLFFGLSLFRFAGIQRIMLFAALLIWGALQFPSSPGILTCVNVFFGSTAFFNASFLGRSRVFCSLGFQPADLIDANTQPFLILDLHGKIIYANNEFLRFTGYRKHELLGREAIELFEIPSNWMMRLDSGEKVRKIRCRLIRGDNEKTPILLWVSEIRSKWKRLRNLLCLIYDESEHKAMQDKINAEARRFAGLHETSRALSSSLEMKDVLAAIAAAAESLTDSDTCTIFTLDHARRMIRPLYSTEEVYSDEVMNFEFAVDQGLTGRVVGDGKPRIQNFDDDDDLAVLIPGTSDEEESLLSVPLKAKNAVIGALTLYKTGRKRFDKENIETLAVFASQAATVLETSRLYMKIKESEKVYRTSVDLAGDGIMFVDTQSGKIIDANETARKMLDYTKAELVSKCIWEVHPQPQMQIARQLWQSVKNNGNDMLSEIIYESKDGRIVPASVNASMIATGDNEFIQWVVRDMTEYKKSMDRMGFFHDVLSTLAEPVMISDTAGMVSFANDSFRNFFSAESAMGDCIGNEKLSLASLNIPILEEIWDSLKGRSFYAGDVILNTGKDNQVTRTVHVIPKYDGKGSLTHHFWIFYTPVRRSAGETEFTLAEHQA
jgi:PAS domain S-box-containing protein